MLTNREMWSLVTIQSDINTELKKHFKARINDAKKIDIDYKFMWQAINGAALAGGKRFRPYLCSLSYGASQGQDYDQLIAVGLAIELLHICLMTHDDVIDRDDIRHNQLNIVGIYKEKYASNLNSSDLNHYARSAAILAGDLLLSDAYQLLNSAGLKPVILNSVTNLFHQAIFSVAGGELLDTEAPLMAAKDVQSLKIARYKTAIYSCSIPLAIGATLAGAEKKAVDLWKQIGETLGIAYQMTDDLLGIFGDQELTGKSNTNDLREEKRTYLLHQTYLLSNSDQLARLKEISLNKNDALHLEKIKQIMIDTGARDKTIKQMQKYARQSKDLLSGLNIDKTYKQAMIEFINSTTTRSA